MKILRVLRLLIIACITFAIIKITTFGCAMLSGKQVNYTHGNSELAKNLEVHVKKLSDEIGERSMFKYEALEKAAEYISGQLKSYGYVVEYQEYTAGGKAAKNIIATKRGLGKENEIVLVGAHYDSCFNPGADDNASGVAGLLELAKALIEEKTERSIKFVAFTNEEPPFFKTEEMGSRVYAKAARQRNENIKAVIILEMIGYYSDKPYSQRYPPLVGLLYPNKANFISVVGNFPSGHLVKKLAAGFKKATGFPIESAVLPGFVPGVDFSDHWSFWKEGYPAIMVTDTAFYRNAHYHQGSDTHEKLNYPSMAEIVTALKKALLDF